MCLNYLELRDVENLVNLVIHSQQSKAREALCIRIGIEPYRLSFIRDSSDSDFVLQLIEYLDRIGNKESLCKLCCKELFPIFCQSEIYAPILRGIAAKLDCDEFIPNLNNNTGKKTTWIEKIVKPKSKLLIGQASFLLISALSLSAIYSYLWLPDIWSSARTQVKVDAKSDPWLAGMSRNSRASSCPNPRPGDLDSIASENSPTEVKEIPLKPGSHLTFKVLEGKTKVFNEQDYFGPEGNIEDVRTHRTKAENGISDIQAPINSLVGVFLGREQPNKDSAPSTLFFSEEAKQNYLKLHPQLKQVFLSVMEELTWVYDKE